MPGLRSSREKGLLFLSAVVSLIATSLIAAALGTNYWITAEGKRELSTLGSSICNPNVKNLREELPPCTAKVNFGLFQGYQDQNNGRGANKRDTDIYVACVPSENLCGLSDVEGSTDVVTETLQDLEDERNSSLDDNTTQIRRGIDSGLFSFALWVTTLVFAGLAMLWGVVGCAFSLLNTFTKPIDTINGPIGLYVWNALAAVCTALTVVMFIALYFVDLKKNVMSGTDRSGLLYNSRDQAYPGFSFYLVVGAIVVFLLNLLVVKCSGYQVRFKRRDDMYMASVKASDMLY